MRKKGFIFDLDGVVVDTAKYHYLAWQQVAEELGVKFTAAHNEQLKGVSRTESLKKILAWGNVTLSEARFMEVTSIKNNVYLNFIKTMGKDEILPAVEATLSTIKTNKHGIALGSASKNARTILRKISLIKAFDAIVDGNDITKAKPNPEVFLKAADLLKITPENCVVFEDSQAGIQAAKQAGMLAIGIGKEENLKGADAVYEGFNAFPKHFLQTLMS